MKYPPMTSWTDASPIMVGKNQSAGGDEKGRLRIAFGIGRV